MQERMSALCQKRTFKKYRHDKERPPRGGLSENSITLTTISSAALLMLHQDLGSDRHARVKICDIVVDQPEAA